MLRFSWKKLNWPNKTELLETLNEANEELNEQRERFQKRIDGIQDRTPSTKNSWMNKKNVSCSLIY